MQDITDKQIEEMAESMIARRIANTGETREQASEFIVKYLSGRVNEIKSA